MEKNGRKDFNFKSNGAKSKKFEKKGKSSANSGKSAKTSDNKTPISEGQGFTFSSNPWDLYATSEAQAANVANFPYNVVSGRPVKWYSGDFNSQPGKVIDAFSFPGAMVITYVPTPGGASLEANSSMNMAARQLYSYIRRANSGARNYEAPDLMMYILALEDIYAEYFELKRYYGMMANFQFMNRYTPDRIVRACGLNPEDLRANLAQYRYQLNNLRLKINSLAVPKYFKSFIRRVVCASNVYSDSTSTKSALYIMCKAGYYTFKPTKYETGGALEFTFRSLATPTTMQARIDSLNAQIEAVITDDDMNTMMGDIIKAFGESGLYVVTDIPAEYQVPFVYDEDILAQIENSRAWSLATTAGHGLDVWQKENVLYYSPKIAVDAINTKQERYNYLLHRCNAIVNSHKDEPNYKDNLEWTRLLSISSGVQFDGGFNLSCGLEIVTGYTIIANIFEDSPSGAQATVSALSCLVPDITGTDLMFSQYVQQFDWHPIMFYFDGTVFSANNGKPYRTRSAVVGDLKNFTIVGAEIMRNIHDCANYAVYYGSGLY